MKANQQPTKRGQQKNSQNNKNSSGVMRIFYVVMLVLLWSSSITRIAGANRHASQSGATPTTQVSPVGGGGTAARVFVFHQENSGTGTCEELVIPATGSAVYSNCGKGVEKRYNLSDSERRQLQSWIQQFQPVNYDHTDKNQAGNVTTQLYLNGQGAQQANDTGTQQMVDFATSLTAKIASQP